VFAILGDIPFQVVGSPEALSDSRGYDYAEHRLVQARPVLQWLADDLMTIQLEMLLHRSFTEPAASLLVLQQAASTHAALPLIFGNGEFRGYFVITGIDTKSRQMSGSGDLFAITVRINLRESPLEFDPAAPPIPSFLPIAIVAAVSAGNSTPAAGASTSGVSALVALTAPSGPASSILLPDDVPAFSIVRSAP
jgi:phage protein U